MATAASSRQLGTTSLLLSLLLATACGPKIPPHLLPENEEQTTSAEEILSSGGQASTFSTVDEVWTYTLRGDPLARSPRLPSKNQVDAIADDIPGLIAWTATASSAGLDNPAALSRLGELTAVYPSEALVVLDRGNRLRIADQAIASSRGQLAQIGSDRLPSLLLGFQEVRNPDELGSHPLAFLAERGNLQDSIRSYADRWVLEGWLAHPRIPLGAVDQALQGPSYTRLLTSGIGRIIHERAKGPSAEPPLDLEMLWTATTLALEEASADSRGEQKTFREHEEEVREAWGVDNPVTDLLRRAVTDYGAQAGHDRSAGAALLAHAAQRFYNQCDIDPCTGLDRMETLQWAGRYDPELARIASVWELLLLKRNTDSLAVGRDTVLFQRAMIDLLDVLMATSDDEPPHADLLANKSPDSRVWNILGEAAGGDPCADWECVERQLKQRQQEALSNLPERLPDGLDPYLRRIKIRSAP